MLKVVKSVNAPRGVACDSTGESTDTDLVLAAKGGDQVAFSELVKRHQWLVYTLACGITGSPSEGDEVAQESFVTAWRKLPELKDPNSFRSWLVGITRLVSRHLGYMHRRHKGFERAFATIKPSSGPSPLDQAITREQEELLWRALGQLPENYRVPILLFYVEQQSIQKVAEALDLTEKNVTVRLTRGRRMLHESVMAFLESAMARLRPPKEFTAAVLVAVAAGASAKATAGAAGGAATSATAKVLLVASLAVVCGASVTVLVRSGEKGGSGEVGLAKTSVRPPVFNPPGTNLLPPRAVEPPAVEVTTRQADSVTPLFNFDFEDGVLSPAFSDGHVVPGPFRTGNKYCVAGTIFRSPTEGPYLSVRLGAFPSTSPIFEYNKDATISFDYWLGHRPSNHRPSNSGGLTVHFWNLDKKSNYGRDIVAVPGQWVHVELRLADDFKPLRPHAPSSMDAGDQIGDLYFGSLFFEDGLYIDNLKIVD